MLRLIKYIRLNIKRVTQMIMERQDRLPEIKDQAVVFIGLLPLSIHSRVLDIKGKIKESKH